MRAMLERYKIAAGDRVHLVETSNAALSPNGRFVAYESTQTGYVEIVVASFPDFSGARVASTLDVGMTINFVNADAREGRFPRWSRDGRELFYRSGRALIRIPMDPDGGRATGPPEVLFTGVVDEANTYDISPDGRRFVAVAPLDAPANEVVVVHNWFDEVRERLAN